MPDKPEPKKPEEKKDEKPTPKDNLVEFHHSSTIGGKELKYTVTTGTMVLKEETADRQICWSITALPESQNPYSTEIKNG